MNDTEYLSVITGESDCELLSFLLKQAESMILAETNRKTIPADLEQVKFGIAKFLYQQHTQNGEASRSEGGISVTYDTTMPQNLLDIVKRYRLVRIGGYAFEKQQTETL